MVMKFVSFLYPLAFALRARLKEEKSLITQSLMGILSKKERASRAES